MFYLNPWTVVGNSGGNDGYWRLWTVPLTCILLDDISCYSPPGIWLSWMILKSPRGYTQWVYPLGRSITFCANSVNLAQNPAKLAQNPAILVQNSPLGEIDFFFNHKKTQFFLVRSYDTCYDVMTQYDIYIEVGEIYILNLMTLLHQFWRVFDLIDRNTRTTCRVKC